MQDINQLLTALQQHPASYAGASIFSLIILAWLGNWVVKRILIRLVYRAINALPVQDDLQHERILARIANIVPALIISIGITAIPEISPLVVTIVKNVVNAFVVLTITIALNSSLDIVNKIYEKRPDANLKPIKGYIQVIKIAIYSIAAILIIALLIDKSPIILFSGLGAMAAVLMLVFQGTLLSLVASIQISSSGIIRLGDWIEMPQVHADGAIIDIALHTVQVQNWDMTITSIPTKRFLSDSFRNWRGMQESGGRRIKRSLFLDQNTVHFLDENACLRLRRFKLLDAYLDEKFKEINEWNSKLEHDTDALVNSRRITNIGTFRAYIEIYLKNHPGIHQGKTLMVRQLSPTAEGLPLEIYCFTNTVAWVGYEKTQSDIFDHLIAILNEFELHVFQNPGGNDLRELKNTIKL